MKIGDHVGMPHVSIVQSMADKINKERKTALSTLLVTRTVHEIFTFSLKELPTLLVNAIIDTFTPIVELSSS